MKYLLLVASLVLALTWAPETLAIGPRGGGGARAAAPRPTPSFSAPRQAPARPPAGGRGGFVPQPRPNVQRPNVPNFSRPGGSIGGAGNLQRPNLPNNSRPGITTLPAPTRPLPGTRPGQLPVQRPPGMATNPGTRPGRIGGIRPGPGQMPMGRPGIGPGGVRPGSGGTVVGGGNNIFNRPNIGSGGNNIINRPGIGGGNIINRPTIGSGNQIFRPDNSTNININRPGGLRPGWGSGINVSSGAWAGAWGGGAAAGTWGGGWAGGGGGGWGGHWVGGAAGAWGGHWGFARAPRYYQTAYGGWYRGAWGGWRSYPAFWAGTGAALGWLGATTAQSFAYSNPYVVSTPVVQTVYDYAQPIPVYVPVPSEPSPVIINLPSDQRQLVEPAPSAPVPGVTPAPTDPATPSEPEAPQDPKVKEAVALFDEARTLFGRNDYAAAQSRVDKAILLLPQDRVLHEFRALVLFAEGKYQDAASTLYAVLAAGPGWNWDTLKSFYPDAAAYTRQLRALEAHAGQNPKAAEDRFVLAYHYLVLGQTDPAVMMLEQVNRLVPQDQLSAQILQALRPKPAADDDRPKPQPG